MVQKKKKHTESTEQTQEPEAAPLSEATLEEALKHMEHVEEAAPHREAPITHTVEAELAAVKDQLIRAVAETENVRKRMQKENDETRKFAATSFAKEMIQVLDTLYRAEETAPTNEVEANGLAKNILEGIRLARKEIETVFERHGIKRVYPLNQKFDHQLHQAMMEVEHAAEPGTVTTVLQAGYTLHDRLLKPAMVIVAKAKTTNGG